MFYHQSENKYIHEGQQFTLDGVTYPSGWLNQSTPEEKLALGLVEVVKTNLPGNPEFYFVNEELNGAELTYVNEPKDLQGIRDRLWEKIKSKRDQLIISGGHKIGNHWYHSDQISLIQQLALHGEAKELSANGAPDSTVIVETPWKTLGGGFVSLTIGIAKNFVKSALAQQSALFDAAEAKLQLINSINRIEDFQDFDVNADWPETYTKANDEALIQP